MVFAICVFTCQLVIEIWIQITQAYLYFQNQIRVLDGGKGFGDGLLERCRYTIVQSDWIQIGYGNYHICIRLPIMDMDMNIVNLQYLYLLKLNTDTNWIRGKGI